MNKRMNQDDTLVTIDLLTDTLNRYSALDVVDFAKYMAKNLDRLTLEAFKEGINSVKV